MSSDILTKILLLIIIGLNILIITAPEKNIHHTFIDQAVTQSKAIAVNDVTIMKDSNTPSALINFYRKEVLFLQIHEDGIFINRNYPLKDVLRHVMNSIDQLSGKDNARSYDYNVYME